MLRGSDTAEVTYVNKIWTTDPQSGGPFDKEIRVPRDPTIKKQVNYNIYPRDQCILQALSEGVGTPHLNQNFSHELVIPRARNLSQRGGILTEFEPAWGVLTEFEPAWGVLTEFEPAWGDPQRGAMNLCRVAMILPRPASNGGFPNHTPPHCSSILLMIR